MEEVNPAVDNERTNPIQIVAVEQANCTRERNKTAWVLITNPPGSPRREANDATEKPDSQTDETAPPY